MATPENFSVPPDPEPTKSLEQAGDFYCAAARFGSKKNVTLAHTSTLEIIRQSGIDLSSIPFKLKKNWYLAVAGMPPPAEIETQIQKLLGNGEPITLPETVVENLRQAGDREVMALLTLYEMDEELTALSVFDDEPFDEGDYLKPQSL